MTNAEKIRAMSDEELRDFILSLGLECADGFFCPVTGVHCPVTKETDCETYVLRWLKDEAEPSEGA